MSKAVRNVKVSFGGDCVSHHRLNYCRRHDSGRRLKKKRFSRLSVLSEEGLREFRGQA